MEPSIHIVENWNLIYTRTPFILFSHFTLSFSVCFSFCTPSHFRVRNSIIPVNSISSFISRAEEAQIGKREKKQSNKQTIIIRTWYRRKCSLFFCVFHFHPGNDPHSTRSFERKFGTHGTADNYMNQKDYRKRNPRNISYFLALLGRYVGLQIDQYFISMRKIIPIKVDKFLFSFNFYSMSKRSTFLEHRYENKISTFWLLSEYFFG